MRVRRVMALAAAMTVCLPSLVQARKDTEVRYRFDQVWGATVRLVRVDYRFPIRDRDEEVGYLLFEYKDGNRSYPGSFELIQTRVHGEDRVRIQLTIPAMPGYIERMMLDKLEKKLEDDYGEPPPPRREPDRREPEGDDGEGKGEDEKRG